MAKSIDLKEKKRLFAAHGNPGELRDTGRNLWRFRIVDKTVREQFHRIYFDRNSHGNLEDVQSTGKKYQETESPSTQLEAKETDKNLEKQIHALKAERDNLASQNELLVSRVAEARRTAVREVQRFDQLQRDHAKLQERNDLLVDRLNERAKANDLIFSSLSERPGCKIRMAQTYEGVVEEVDDDHVVVVYEVDGDIVEQTYLKHQFQDQRLPEVGARLAVYVTVVEVPRTSSQDHSEAEEMTSSDDFAASGRKPLNGPVEF